MQGLSEGSLGYLDRLPAERGPGTLKGRKGGSDTVFMPYIYVYYCRTYEKAVSAGGEGNLKRFLIKLSLSLSLSLFALSLSQEDMPT